MQKHDSFRLLFDYINVGSLAHFHQHHSSLNQINFQYITTPLLALLNLCTYIWSKIRVVGSALSGGKKLAEKNGYQADYGWGWLYFLLLRFLNSEDWVFLRGLSTENVWYFITVPILLHIEKRLPIIFKYKPRGKNLTFLKQHLTWSSGTHMR